MNNWCRGQGLNLRRLGLQPSALPGWATSAQSLGGTRFTVVNSFKVFWTLFSSWFGSCTKNREMPSWDKTFNYILWAFRRLTMLCDLLVRILSEPLLGKTGKLRNGHVHGVVRFFLLWICAIQFTFLLLLCKVSGERFYEAEICILNPEATLGRSSSLVGRRPHAAKITGSNPVRPTTTVR